jgi:hypothetical protein
MHRSCRIFLLADDGSKAALMLGRHGQTTGPSIQPDPEMIVKSWERDPPHPSSADIDWVGIAMIRLRRLRIDDLKSLLTPVLLVHLRSAHVLLRDAQHEIAGRQ